MFTIQAIIGTIEDLKSQSEFKVVTLEQGLALLPISSQIQEKYNIPFLPLTDLGIGKVPKSIVETLKKINPQNPIIYIEAEYFGGDGVQASVYWDEKQKESCTIVSDNAINQALKKMSVDKKNKIDEFEAIGLGKHRSTESWINEE